ncbi:hypothetical protein GCM10029992_44280 [Glycomyces albus]
MGSVFTIVTVNVNGIRAAAKKGIVDYLAASSADVVLMQEVRATTEQVPAAVTEVPGWHWLLAPALNHGAKGRAGVAILTRDRPEAERVGFGSESFDDNGRYAEVDLPGITIGSLYLPSGETDTPRQVEKSTSWTSSPPTWPTRPPPANARAATSSSAATGTSPTPRST